MTTQQRVRSLKNVRKVLAPKIGREFRVLAIGRPGRNWVALIIRSTGTHMIVSFLNGEVIEMRTIPCS